MKTITDKDSSEKVDSVDQIRDILFGKQINIIEKRFKQLENNFTNAINDLSNKVDQNNKDLKELIDKSNNELQTENSNLSQRQSDDIRNLEAAINNKIIETESDLLNQIHSGLEKLEQKASHRNELAQLLKDMADKLTN